MNSKVQLILNEVLDSEWKEGGSWIMRKSKEEEEGKAEKL